MEVAVQCECVLTTPVRAKLKVRKSYWKLYKSYMVLENLAGDGSR